MLSHTSDQHEWFKKSKESKKNKFSDWYVWQDGRSDVAPNNWLSVFGGSSWEWDENREKYYLHNFLTSQPDLNFHNEEVQNQMLEEIEYWLKFGVDGFRFDVINFLFHDKELRNNSSKDPKLVRPLGFNKDNPYGLQIHEYDNTRPEVIPYLEKIRGLLDKYDAISIGEIVSEDPLETIGDYTNEKRLHMAYCFEFLSEDINFETIDGVVENFFENHPQSWPCWAFSNHDSKRIASRVNKDPQIIMEKLLGLKGNICIYQGEELGLLESDVGYDYIQDPFGKNFWPEFKGRDGCRVPIPWDSKLENFGFSKHDPWLPIDKRYQGLCVDIQQNNPDSTLNFTRDLIALRKKIAT